MQSWVCQFFAHIGQEQLGILVVPLDLLAKLLDDPTMAQTYAQHFRQATDRETFETLKKKMAVPSTPLLESLVLRPSSNRNLDPSTRNIDESSIRDRLLYLIIPEKGFACQRFDLLEDIYPLVEWRLRLQGIVVTL